ncbi:MAG: hypothetical protein E7522_04915 [Ruminococcaceae bacterium]|nr:hypothetical protein [Oscillospiraceae bacterium]
MNSKWNYVPFDSLFDWKQKSHIKSGDGQKNGLYKMFVCSDTEIKRFNEYIESGESLVFGTGGKASCHFVDEKFAYSTDCVVAQKKKSDICTKFYYYYLRQNRLNSIQQTFTGSGLQHTSKKKIGALLVPVVDFETQKCIVAKIEELFSELDNNIETLKNTKQQLAVYRQAVLKAAFEGELTGVVDIRKISLNDMVSGKEGLRRGPFGSSIKKSCFVSEGFKVYEQGNAINNDPYRGNYYITPEKYEELTKFHVKPHDLLVSCSGVTLGRIVELPDDAKSGVINQALLRIRLNHNVVNSKYFIAYFRSELFQRKIFDKSQGSAMPNLVGIKEFKNIKMNVPLQISDQLSIVHEIESRFSVCDNIEKTVNDALQQSEAMRQGILKQAFEGKI